MTDEFALHRDIHRAAKAKALLESELLIESFKTLEESYIKAWRTTGAFDDRDREKLFQAVNIIGKVKDNLIAVISDGTIAQAELDKLLADAERRKRHGKV